LDNLVGEGKMLMNHVLGKYVLSRRREDVNEPCLGEVCCEAVYLKEVA
jgi:hypothetical protein